MMQSNTNSKRRVFKRLFRPQFGVAGRGNLGFHLCFQMRFWYFWYFSGTFARSTSKKPRKYAVFQWSIGGSSPLCLI